MKRLKLLILVFCVAISLPLAYVVRQSFQGLAEEERAQLRFFSQTLFDEMEGKLAEWVQQEENRAVDEYHHTLSDGRGGSLSPLARAPREAYILGYLQNNPDGSFQTPLMADPEHVPEEKREVVTQLEAANSIFNRKKLTLAVTPPAPEPKKAADAPKMEAEKKEKDGFADRYLARPQEQAAKSYLGQKLPASPARRTLTLALMVLGVFMLLGLFAIYQSVRTVVDLSERRSQFVSSVTHELKTPLTNIRMYIEMLEQGIAATPEREQDYFHILGSESARLSRLINNVLELAKLEKKQRRFDLQPGNLQEVLSEVRTVMAHKLAQEGFTLKIDVPDDLRFAYDREVMIQVLINLIENSIKFGRTSPERTIAIAAALRDGRVHIAVSDTGPGIPGKALKKVFDDFYRVDNALTRATGGTGIGLALVKKFILAMEGQVRAANNPGPGCTITLSLPAIRRNDGAV